jgi:hypothetical protein
MKKIFSVIFSICFFGSSFGQTNLPKYYIENGDTLGITMPISKMKQIKNDLELKMVLETMKISCDSTISRYIVLVDDYERRISTFKTTISRMDSVDKKSTSLIDTLNYNLNLERKDKSFHKQISAKKDTIIANNESIIRDLKFQRNLGIGGGSTFFVLSVVLSIFLLIH